jgi:hypothetical protein
MKTPIGLFAPKVGVGEAVSATGDPFAKPTGSPKNIPAELFTVIGYVCMPAENGVSPKYFAMRSP